MTENPNARRVLLLLEYLVCMAGPLVLVAMGLLALASGVVDTAIVLTLLGGVVGVGGALWALVYDATHGEPPLDIGARVTMGVLLGVGCAVAVVWGVITVLGAVNDPRLENLAAVVFSFALPLVHGLRRLRWVARGRPPKPRRTCLDDPSRGG